MGMTYATVSDVEKFRTLTAQEREQTEELLETASSKLRITAKDYGCDIDCMIANDEDIAAAAKAIIVQAVMRALNSLTDSTPPSVQASQAALGYSVSMTYLNSGQSLYFLKNELKELGLLRQRYGAMEVYGK